MSVVSATDPIAPSAQDTAVLSAAAGRLRRMGWFWFGWSALHVVIMFIAFGIGARRVVPLFLGIGTALLAVASFYHLLARYVERGRLWAIGLALFLVSVFVSLLLVRLLTPRPVHLVVAVFESFYLIATLNLLRSLVRGWGAARRLADHRTMVAYHTGDHAVCPDRVDPKT